MSFGRLGVQDLVPAHHPLAVAGHDLRQPLVEVGLQLVVVPRPFSFLKAARRSEASQCLPFTSSPPMWRKGSGKSAAISPRKPSRKR